MFDLVLFFWKILLSIFSIAYNNPWFEVCGDIIVCIVEILKKLKEIFDEYSKE